MRRKVRSIRSLKVSWSLESTQNLKALRHMEDYNTAIANQISEIIDNRITHELVNNDYFKIIQEVIEKIVKTADPDEKTEIFRGRSYKDWHEIYHVVTKTCPDSCPTKDTEIIYDGEMLRVNIPYRRDVGLNPIAESLSDPNAIQKIAIQLKDWIDYTNSENHMSRHDYLYLAKIDHHVHFKHTSVSLEFVLDATDSHPS